MTTASESIFVRFWKAYGGFSPIFKSTYFILAVALNLFCWGLWSEPNWWDLVFSVIPNLLGFTLGGFAIFVGFGDEKFTSSLAEPETDPTTPSVYREFCATFVHFIIVQVAALLLAVISKGMYFQTDWPQWAVTAIKIGNVFWGAICFNVFLYALTSVLAIGFHVFRIANMYEMHHQMIESAKQELKVHEERRAALAQASHLRRRFATMIRDRRARIK